MSTCPCGRSPDPGYAPNGRCYCTDSYLPFEDQLKRLSLDVETIAQRVEVIASDIANPEKRSQQILDIARELRWIKDELRKA